MLLYKFVSTQRAITILESSTIRFTQLAALNDPFESFPPIEGFVTKDSAFHILDSILSNDNLVTALMEEIYKFMYENLPPEQKQLYDFQSFRSNVKASVDANLAYGGNTLSSLVRTDLESRSDTFLPTMKQNIITSIINKICVLSLSTAITNPVMWTYYADSHRGMAIGFDPQDPFFSKYLEVQYQNERPKVDLFQIPDGEQEKLELAKAILATKKTFWAQEEEHRLINSTALLQDSHTLDSDGYPVFVAAFPNQSVREIVLGCNTPGKSKKYISELAANKYSHAILKVTILDTQALQINFNTL